MIILTPVTYKNSRLVSDLLGDISVDYVKRPGGSLAGEHIHTHYEISVVLSGKMTVTNNGKHFDAEAPCVILHFPGSFHTVVSAEGTLYERYNINYTTECFKKCRMLLDCTEKLFLTNGAVLPVDADAIDELLYYLKPLYAEKGGGEKKSALLCVLLCVLNERLGGRLCPDDRKGSYINAVLRYIADNLSPVMTAERIAAEFFVSRAKLAADFRRETGMTLKRYTELLTTERAKRLLYAGRTVQATAIETGFSDSAAFIRTFRRATGQTPGEYRRRVRSTAGEPTEDDFTVS